MWNGGFSINGKEVNTSNGCGTLTVTSEYGKTVGWEFLQGRDFSRELTSDSTAFIVNESFAKRTGLQNPVGQTMVWAPGWRDPQPFTIIGVVRDMVALSPYKAAIPTVFFMEDKYRTWINIRLKAGVGVSEALAKVGDVFKRLTPSAPFEYKFADEEYALKFAAEERISKLAILFATLAIFISCLGLFGLASFIAEQRTKEIGIRRVVGASVFNVWRLLSKDFVLLTLLSCLIAAPIAYYYLHEWLQNYQYHTDIKWWFFIAAASGVLGITLLTVSFQAIKAAIANPVKSLRSE
jgi:ABC-type antimicrobial peptide transport system permease subunit